MSKAVSKVADFALPIIGGIVGGPVGAAVGGAAAGATKGQGLKGIGIGALTGYAGNALGSTLGSTLTKSLGSVGGTSLGSMAGNVVGPVSGGSLFGGASNALTNTIANTTVGGALGKFAGNKLAGDFSESLLGGDEPSEPSGPGASPFSPTRESQMELPSSLSSFGDLAPEQQSSNIATQGVYGGGLGGQEQQYFKNLINRRLIDESGNVDADLSEVSPIESSYLSQLGLGGYANSRDLLEALSKWKPM